MLPYITTFNSGCFRFHSKTVRVSFVGVMQSFVAAATAVAVDVL